MQTMEKDFRQHSIRLTVLAGAMLIFTLSLPAAASQVYTWTDENGVTHFSDRQPPETETQVIDMTDKPGGVTYSKPQSASEQESTAGDAADTTVPDPTPGQQRREQIAQGSAERRAAEADQSAMCQKQRDLLARLEPARRVYYTNEKGEEARMDDQQRIQAIAETRDYIARYCD